MRAHLFVFLFMFVILSIASFRMAKAFFVSSAVSSNNTFATAEAFPSATPTATLTPTITPTSTITEGLADHIVISEVQIDGGPSEADHDFIELYNPTNSTVDLNGHRIVSRTGNSSTDDLIVSFATSTIIPAHGFFLWARDDDAAFVELLDPDVTSGDSLTSSMSIALRNGPSNTGTIIDALSWNSGSTFGEGTNSNPPPDDGSLERKAYATSDATSMVGADATKGNGYDTDNNSLNFVLRTVSQPQNSSSSTETP